MSTLFGDVNKKIGEMFRDIEEYPDNDRIKDLQTILTSFSKILQNQDSIINVNRTHLLNISDIFKQQKISTLRKTLDENIMTMQKVNDDLKDFSNRVVPEMKKDISDVWQFCNTMQDHVIHIEKVLDVYEMGIVPEKEPKVEKATFEIPVKVEDAIAEAKEKDQVRILTKRKGLKLK